MSYGSENGSQLADPYTPLTADSGSNFKKMPTL
jgi:hypothetical protein